MNRIYYVRIYNNINTHTTFDDTFTRRQYVSQF